MTSSWNSELEMGKFFLRSSQNESRSIICPNYPQREQKISRGENEQMKNCVSCLRRKLFFYFEHYSQWFSRGQRRCHHAELSSFVAKGIFALFMDKTNNIQAKWRSSFKQKTYIWKKFVGGLLAKKVTAIELVLEASFFRGFERTNFNGKSENGFSFTSNGCVCVWVCMSRSRRRRSSGSKNHLVRQSLPDENFFFSSIISLVTANQSWKLSASACKTFSLCFFSYRLRRPRKVVLDRRPRNDLL